MSERKAKAGRKMEVVTGEADPREAAVETAKSIRKMYEDRDKKAVGAKQHLIDQLLVTVDKYKTANGVMSALATVRDVFHNSSFMSCEEEINVAKVIATEMSGIAMDMHDKARKLDPDEMDKLCDGFYSTEYSKGDGNARDLVRELMIIQLCQNVGPDACDIAEFCKQANLEIERAREDLKANCKENGLVFEEICKETEKDFDFLCLDCEKSCLDSSKKVKPGQSPREVCRKFVRSKD